MILAVGVLAAGCAAGGSATCEYRTQESVSRLVLERDRGDIVELSVREIASLPPETVFLAGSYGDGPMCSALLVSRDAGVTWREIGPRFRSCAISNLRTFGKTHIWGLATFRVEGCDEPVALIASRDAGVTWDVVPLDFVHLHSPLPRASYFAFQDGVHGILSIAGTVGPAATYVTEDGGATWRRLWDFQPGDRDVDGYDGYWVPGERREYDTALLWHQDTDYFKASGVLRTRLTEDETVVEFHEYSDESAWAERSRIPRSYKAWGDRLVPIIPGDPFAWADRNPPPLLAAVLAGREGDVEKLLANGADIEQKDAFGYTPLHISLRAENYSVAEFLLSRGANIAALAPLDHRHDWQKGTPLHQAAGEGKWPAARLLLSHGADVNAQTCNGECQMVATPLEEAVDGGHKDMVKRLLEAGADGEGAGHVFFWPLQIAAVAGRADIIQVLLDHGAEIDRSGVDGAGSLHFAVLEEQVASVEFLLSRGADANARGFLDDTPLHWAANSGNAEVAAALLANGADPKSVDRDGKTPEMIAVEQGHHAFLDVLSSHRAQGKAEDHSAGSAPSPADIPLQDGTVVHLAAAAEGAGILGAEDDYIRALGVLEMSAKGNVDREVTRGQFAKFTAAQAGGLTEAEREKVEAAFARVRARLAALKLTPPFPAVITVIKTTGREEGGAAYTRGAAIVLPEGRLRGDVEALDELVTHELFHIMTTADPSLRTPMYAIVGFHPCTEAPLPEELTARRLTNPDAIANDHFMEVAYEGRRINVIPITFLSAEAASRKRQTGLFERALSGMVGGGQGSFFEDLVFKLMAVEKRGQQWRASLVDGRPLLLDPYQVPEYNEKMGYNTGYIIHPEEALAETFVIMLEQKTDIPNPEIPAKMLELLLERGAGKLTP